MFESEVNRKDTKKKRTEKGTHDITEKDTEQPKSSRSKQTSTYPGHSAGLQGWVPLLLHIVRCRPGQSR